jgi:thiol-disulfide isomerase/thioredoxin
MRVNGNMNTKYLHTGICLLLLLGFQVIAVAQGYELKVRIKNLSGKDLILGHYYGDKRVANDTIKLDMQGQGTFKGSKKLPEGMYFLLTPARKSVDIFMTANQTFSVETDNNSLFESLKFSNSPENAAAQTYIKSLVNTQKESASIRRQIANQTNPEEIKKAETQLRKIATDNKTLARQIIEDQKINFVGKYIKANQPVDVPPAPRDAKGKVLDSTFQIRYYRSHFFNNIDLRDARFLRSPLYDQKIKEYFDKVVYQDADTICRACDQLLGMVESNQEIFKYLLITLFNKYVGSTVMGFDAIYVHIAENWYIPKASFSDPAFIKQTRENVKILKPLLLGQTAPDLSMLRLSEEQFIDSKTNSSSLNNIHAGTNIRLNEVRAKYTIVVFWECDCSHCMKEIPELYSIYQRLKPKGVEVFSVHMLGGTEGQQKWIKFVNEHQLYDWINVWNPDDFGYKKTFDIGPTPMTYILDQNKKIIAKKLDPKQIDEFLSKRILMDREKSN